MKKLSTILIAGFVSFQIYAQTEQGTVLLGGNTSFDFSSTTLNKTEPSNPDDKSKTTASGMDLTLDGGYFLIDGLAAGLQVGYASDKDKTTDEDYESTAATSGMMIAPFVRYYIAETGIWAQASYGFGSGKYETTVKMGGDTETSTSEVKLSAIGIGIGYGIGLNDYVSLNPMIGYNMQTSTVEKGAIDPDSGKEVDYVEKWGGIGFGLGLNVHLY